MTIINDYNYTAYTIEQWCIGMYFEILGTFDCEIYVLWNHALYNFSI